MNENVWDKIVELGREYIELRAEDDRLTARIELKDEHDFARH